MNLIKADLFHLRKNKVFWVLLCIIAIMPIASCIMMKSVFGNAMIDSQSIILQGVGVDIMATFLGIAISMFVGKDYVNRTIRNKLCYGEKRYKVVAVKYLMSILMTIVAIVVSFAFSLLSTAIFGEISFTAEFWCTYLCQAAIIFAFSILITSLCICTKSEKAGFIYTLIAAVLLSAFSQLLPQLAQISDIARVASRCIYTVVSNMLVGSVGGIYTVTETVSFGGMYLNALLMSLAYIVVSVGVTLFVVRKQSYK